MTEPMRVEPADLRAKAGELDIPLPAAPAEPSPPCGLELAAIAVAQVSAEGTGMKSFIEAGQEEAKMLALALQGAATAYEATDQAGAAAIDGTVAEIARAEIPKLDGVVPRPQMPLSACPGPPGYLDVSVAAEQIAQPDQAATLETFAADWSTYATQMDSRSEDFDLDGKDWEGAAATLARTALQRHKDWLKEMASAARTTAEHARALAAVHRKAAAAHPTVAEVQSVTARLSLTNDALQMSRLMDEYRMLQERSEQVLGAYAAEAVIRPVEPPIPPIRDVLINGDPGTGGPPQPPQPPGSVPSATEPGGGSGSGSGGAAAGQTRPGAQPMAGTQAGQPSGTQTPETAPSAGGAPSGGSPSGGGSGGGSPSGGGLPSGGLPGGDGTPDTGLPDLGLDDPGVSPASLGGGSGGGAGGGGVPSMPLQPNVGPETVAPGPAAARGGGSGAIPPSAMGGGMGGMGGGMGGMGHGGGQQGKEKRRDPRFAPDEELYVEDRPYTEPVIGNRRRRDVQDKEST